MSDERVRLFAALDLPSGVREALAGWARARAGETPHIRTVEPESLHVTLCFLGSRPAAEISRVARACREAVSGLRPAALAVDRALWLPRRRPRVLAVALQDEEGRLATIQSALAEALGIGGFYTPERRPFLAHVTVARVRGDGRLRAGDLAAPEPLRFTAGAVTLYRSRLGHGPARYEVIDTTEL